jgi:DNA primase
MSLPPNFLDELRARTPMAALVSRRVKLSRSGKNMKGCCPFHNEKTPSFYVYEDGYHCFGCGAHGDAIGFVMQSQGIGFMEAVEALAGEAGLEVPKPTPAAAEAERRRAGLADVMVAAQAFYRRRLLLPEGARALSYLRERGLTDATIERFGLGWSGEGRGALVADLARQDMPQALLHEAGLLRSTEDGSIGGELFYNRVMFPIRDRRGRVISFGGRTLSDGQPKYVNGPETPLFSKRRTLYGLDFAREAVRGGAALVAVEGYMDVIALHQGGFGGAVAPLGTALTDEQLQELWRLSPSPVLCFDGDSAGLRAAGRAMELALPLLSPEQTLRIATLPAGEDPDTLLRTQGAEAVQGVLDGVRPLADSLYDALRAASAVQTPEQRAAFRTRLEDAAGRIADRSLGSEYRRAWLDRFFTRPAAPRRGVRAASPPLLVQRTRPSPGNAARERARAMVAILLRHPKLLPDVEEAFGALDLPAGVARLRDAILRWGETAQSLDSTALMSHLTLSGMESEVVQVLASVPVPLPACSSPDAMPADAEAGWWHFFGLMDPGRLEAEVAAARRDFAERADETAQRRLVALSAAREALRRGEEGDLDS